MSNKAVWKGTAITAPVPPVMVTCGEPGKANIITVAWTGTVNTKPPMTYISVRPTRYSYGIIKTGGEFVVNLTTAALVKKADYCGIYTGAKVDKFRKCGLTEGQVQKYKEMFAEPEDISPEEVEASIRFSFSPW